MADGDQGVFTFPGIEGELSASLTFTNGINPSVTQVSVPPYEAWTRVGTATWTYGGVVRRQFPNSVAEKIGVKKSGGKTIWDVAILDRRWMWLDGNGSGQISGEYNIGVGDEVIPKYEKTPRELATLCLEAMGETGYDVDALPEDDRPHVKWEIANPAKALADLCDLYSCEVSLLIDDTVKIVKRGTGATMPTGYLSLDEIFDPSEPPNKLVVLSAPTEWEAKLYTESVGWEFEEVEPKLIDDLSYAPKGLQNNIGPKNDNKEPDSWAEAVDKVGDFQWLGEDGRVQTPLEKKQLELANEHIYRSFRVTIGGFGQWIGQTVLPDTLVEIEEVEQILPLIPLRVQTEGSGAFKRRKKPNISGWFDDGEPFNGDPEFLDDELNSIYRGNVSIDAQRGIIHFPEVMRDLAENPEADRDPVLDYAILLLRCSINLYNKDTREVQRYKWEKTVDAASPSGTEYIVRDDVVLQYYYDYEAGIWVDNKDEVEAALDFYADQVIQKYQSFPASTAQYEGFLELDADGAIRQVTYTIDQSHKATTTVARNMEQTGKAISYKEARDKQKLKDALKERDRLARLKDDPKFGFAVLNEKEINGG